MYLACQEPLPSDNSTMEFATYFNESVGAHVSQYNEVKIAGTRTSTQRFETEIDGNTLRLIVPASFKTILAEVLTEDIMANYASMVELFSNLVVMNSMETKTQNLASSNINQFLTVLDPSIEFDIKHMTLGPYVGNVTFIYGGVEFFVKSERQHLTIKQKTGTTRVIYMSIPWMWTTSNKQLANKIILAFFNLCSTV